MDSRLRGGVDDNALEPVLGAETRCPDEEFSVSGSCMSKHLQYPDTEAIPEDLNADG